MIGKPPLVGRLRGAECGDEFRIIGERHQLFELTELRSPGRADVAVDQPRQIAIGECQPAARRDAVGAIDEAAGKQPVEVGEDCFAQQLRVQLRNPVDLVARQDGQVGHPHATHRALVDQRNAAQQRNVVFRLRSNLIEKQLVDVVDDLHVARQHAFEKRHRPRLERLGHQRVIGVREDLRAQAPSQRPRDVANVDQQPHQFRNCNGGMRVIEVNGDLVGQLLDARLRLEIPAQQILQRRADKEVFLTQPQLLAGVGAVVGIKNAADVLRTVLLFDRRAVIAAIEERKVDRLGRGRRPQAQRVDRTRPVAGNQRVVRHREHILGIDPRRAVIGGFDAATEADRVLDLRPDEFPRVALNQPVIRRLDLAAIMNALRKHPVFVADAVAESGQRHRGHRIEEARGEPTKAAVAERGIRFERGQFLEIEPEFA